MKMFSRVFTVLAYAFLFAPILILLVFSFNTSKSLSVFSGVSLHWYRELFRDRNTLMAVRNTLVLALCATAVSTVLGTAAAWGIDRLQCKWFRRTVSVVTDIPITNPDIITGI